MEHSKVCEFCGKSFVSSRSDAKFCSANCRTKFSKMKKIGHKVPRDPFGGELGAVVSDVVFHERTEAGLLTEVLRRLIELNDRLKDQEETYLSIVQVCEMLSISKSTFDRYVKDGLLKAYYLRGKESKTKKKIYVRKSEVLSLFQAMK